MHRKQKPKSTTRFFANRRRSLRKQIKRLRRKVGKKKHEDQKQELEKQLKTLEQELADNIRISRNMVKIENRYRTQREMKKKQVHKVSRFGSGGHEISGGLPSLGKKK